MSPISPAEHSASLRTQLADAARGRAFLLRMIATLAVLAIYQFSGVSARLIESLQVRFDGSWWAVHIIYLLVTLFGLGSLLLPLSLYEDFIVEAQETGEETDFAAWLPEIFRSLAIDLAAGLAFFLALYGLMFFLPRTWWIAAAALYTAITWVASIVPQFQGPPADELTELRHENLPERLAAILQRAGLPACKLLRWHGEGSGDAPMLMLQGIGNPKAVILSDALIREFSSEEIEAMLAHEASHPHHADTTRFNVLGGLLALASFGATALIAKIVSLRFAGADIASLPAFPFFAGLILTTTFAGVPVLNAYTRRREYAADAFAAKLAGETPLRSALEKLNDGDKTAAPASVFDLLLHAQPDVPQRLWRLQGSQRA